MIRRRSDPFGMYSGQYMMVPARRRRGTTIRVSGKAVAWGTRVSYTHRRGMAPFFVLAALAATATAAWFWPGEIGPRGALGVLLLAGLFVGWRHVRAYRRHRTQRWQWPTVVHVWVSWAVATAWAVAVAAAGWSLGALFWLVVPWLVSSVRYWWRMRERDDEPAELSGIDQIADRWYNEIAANGKKLPGSNLVGVEFIEDDPRVGWQATIEVDASRHTTADAITAGPQIAAVWAVPATSVMVTPHPSSAENLARIKVFKKNPLQVVQRFTHPTLDKTTGRFELGVHPDRSPAYWRLWVPGSGACHGMVAGTTGSGKSVALTLIAIEGLASELAVVCVGDTENGESVPALQEDVHCFTGTVPNIRDMCLGLIAVGRHRRRKRSTSRSDAGHRGKGFFDPTPDEPLWMGIIDEAPAALLDPIIVRCVKEIVTKYRKYGIGIVLGLQVPSIAELGNDLAIRSMLASLNVAVFRTGDRMSGTMATPVEFATDPSKLPESWPDGSTTAGLGMVANESGRTKHMRARYVADPYQLVQQLPKIAPPADEVAAFNTASGALWENWLARLDESPEEDTNDPLAPLIAGRSSSEPANAGAVVAGPGPSKRDQILEYVRGRSTPVSTGVIREAVGAPLSTVSTTCARLHEEGLLVKVTRGVWQDPESYQVAKEATERLLDESVA